MTVQPKVTPLSIDDAKAVYKLYGASPDVWLGNQIRVAWYRYWEMGSISSRWDGIWLDGVLVAAVHWSLRASPNGSRTVYDLSLIHI